MRKYIVLLFLLNFSIYAADKPSGKVLFEKYLKENYNYELPNSLQYYIVAQAMGCETCKKIDFEYLTGLARNGKYKIIISYPNRLKLPESVKKIMKEENVWIDRGAYYKLNITPITDGIIISKNRKVSAIFKIDAIEKELVDEVLEKYRK